MKRSYTKIADFLVLFRESGENIVEVDTSFWTSNKIAVDSIRRRIRQRGYKDIFVTQRGERVFVIRV